MVAIDVSLVLNVHDERSYLRRTLRSLEEAARYAAAAGVVAELVIVLDRSPADTRSWVASYRNDAFADIRLLQVDNGSPGLSRDDGARYAIGTYVMFCDADDLISFNSLLAMVRTAAQTATKTLVFTEYILEFDSRFIIEQCFDLSVVTPLSFIDDHPYTSRALLRRVFFDELRYHDAGSEHGYAHEDWHFNCEALASGYDIVTAPQTVLFYRKRANSVMTLAERNTVRQIRPSRLFVPSVYRTVCEPFVPALRARAQSPERRPRPADAAAFLRSPLFRELIHKANRIDPGVDIQHYRPAAFWSPANNPLHAGMLYYEACKRLDDEPYTDIFLLPFLVTGGADKELIQIMEGLHATQPYTRILIVCGQQKHDAEWLDRLPPNTTFIDLCKLTSASTDAAIDQVTYTLIQSLGTRARIHLKSCEFTNRFFIKYRTAFRKHHIIYYRFADDKYLYEGRMYVDKFSFSFLSDCLSDIDLLITDSQRMIETDRDRFGIDPEKWACLPARCDTTTTADAAAARAARRQDRLLWASRIDWQKRPELLLLIDDELQRRKSSVTIEIFGRPLMNRFDVDNFATRPRLQYKGPFSDFGEIDHRRYDGFVYTSMFDGVPNVVLEAMAAGLPVIAPDCDGLPEVVLPGETGILVPNLPGERALAAAYCDAIEELLESAADRIAMSRNCVTFIERTRSGDAYCARLDEILGGALGH